MSIRVIIVTIILLMVACANSETTQSQSSPIAPATATLNPPEPTQPPDPIGTLAPDFSAATLTAEPMLEQTSSMPSPVDVLIDSELRISTLNVENTDLPAEHIADTIRRSGSNVVLLQGITRTQAETLAARTVMNLHFVALQSLNVATTDDQAAYDEEVGLAVLSNVALVFGNGESLTSLVESDGLQWVQLMINGSILLNVYNVWFGPFTTLNHGDNEAQMEALLQRISSDNPTGLPGLMIVGGSFNSSPESPVMQRMNTVFSDPLMGFIPEMSATIVQDGVSERIDYLWLSNDFHGVLSAMVIDSSGSVSRRMTVIAIDPVR